jgi:hypothetical protein
VAVVPPFEPGVVPPFEPAFASPVASGVLKLRMRASATAVSAAPITPRLGRKFIGQSSEVEAFVVDL